jgi:hypothetical protein
MEICGRVFIVQDPRFERNPWRFSLTLDEKISNLKNVKPHVEELPQPEPRPDRDRQEATVECFDYAIGVSLPYVVLK